MSHRRSLAVVAAVLATFVLSSCALDAPTDQIYNPAVGVNDQEGAVDVLNAAVVSASDGTGTLIATLVNNDLENDDELISVAGEEGVQATLAGDTTIEAGGLLSLADEGAIRVEGEAVVAGFFVEITFAFDRGSSVTLDVPVVSYTSDGAYADVPVD